MLPPPSSTDPPRAKPQWPWIVGSAVVIAGLSIAVALFLTRSHKVETVYIASGGSPAASIVAPAGPTVGVSVSPSGEGAGGTQADQSTQQLLEQAATGAKTIDSTTGSMTRANSLGLAPSFPSLTFRQAFDPSTGPTELSLAITPTTWAAASLSKSGTCWWIKVDASADGATYGTGDTCTGQSAAAATATQWPAAPPASPSP
jgi:hypothetical protein